MSIAYLLLMLVGIMLGLALGALRWRKSVIALNRVVAEKDQQIQQLLGSCGTEPQGIIPPFAIGLKLYRSNKFLEAFPILLHHAKQGHAHATSLVAKMYYAGIGVEKNETEYQFWLKRAAELGDKSAKAKSKKIV